MKSDQYLMPADIGELPASAVIASAHPRKDGSFTLRLEGLDRPAFLHRDDAAPLTEALGGSLEAWAGQKVVLDACDGLLTVAVPSKKEGRPLATRPPRPDPIQADNVEPAPQSQERAPKPQVDDDDLEAPLPEGLRIADLLDNDEDDVDADEERLALPVRSKPEKFAMVRVHPTIAAKVRVIRVREGMEELRFVIAPGVLRQLEDADLGRVDRVTWHLAIEHRTRDLWVWEVSRDPKTWGVTRREAVRRAVSEWIAVTTREGQQGYFVRPSKAELPEPDWKGAPVDGTALVALAARNRIVTSMDHPVIRQLLTTGV